MSSITVHGMEAFLARLDRFKPAVRTALRAAAVHVKGKISVYPPKMAGRPMHFVSLKQRIAVMAMIRSGEIEVPYRRGQSPNSESLGRRWTIADQDDGLTQIVGNNASYGPWVQGEQQAAYHKEGGWKTTEQVSDEERPYVVGQIHDAIMSQLLGGG
jgi:hypothetical protein